MSSPLISPRFLTALVVLGTLAPLGDAQARPVTASDVQITYRFMDDDGTSSTTELQTTDLTYYVNRARCECGEQFAARVNLQRSMDEAYDDNQLRTYVGSQCDLGQDSFGPMTRPCVEMFVGQPNEYDDGGIDIIFDLVWLSSRVPNLDDQSPLTADPINPCAGTQTGEAGVWLCAEDGMQTDCQSSEFIISGTQNQNGGMGAVDPMTGESTSSGGIVFDYLPPQATVTGFESSPGDGAVVIRWDRTESTQINGFRVLCADMDGNPVEGRGESAPPASQRTNGKLYYTAENLCPGEVIYNTPDGEEDDPDPFDTGTGTGTDTGTDTESGDESGTTGDPARTSAATSGTGDAGTTTGGDSDSDATAGDTGGLSVLDSPLASLDWDFVCSDHISGTGTSARVDGLQNGVEYQFIVVAYDAAGNPLIVSGDQAMVEIPEETTDFWEQCEAQGDLCGTGGFCQCSLDEPTGAAWLGSGLLLLTLAGLRRRNR